MSAILPILMYHQIDATPARGTPLRGLTVTPGSFARQMGLLRLLGYKGLSMGDMEPYLRGEKSGRVVGITFDGTGQVRTGDRVFFLSSDPSAYSQTTITLEVRLIHGSTTVVDAEQVKTP